MFCALCAAANVTCVTYVICANVTLAFCNKFAICCAVTTLLFACNSIACCACASVKVCILLYLVAAVRFAVQCIYYTAFCAAASIYFVLYITLQSVHLQPAATHPRPRSWLASQNFLRTSKSFPRLVVFCLALDLCTHSSAPEIGCVLPRVRFMYPLIRTRDWLCSASQKYLDFCDFSETCYIIHLCKQQHLQNLQCLHAAYSSLSGLLCNPQRSLPRAS